MMVMAQLEDLSEEETDKYVLDTIIKVLKSPRLEMEEGYHSIRLVKEGNAWKVIPESPPFYLFEN